MIKDDWLLRQISELAEALAGIRTDVQEQVDLEGSLAALDPIARQLTGMSLDALDALPPVAIRSVVPEAKRAAVAEVLELAAEIADAMGAHALAAARRSKAAVIR